MNLEDHAPSSAPTVTTQNIIDAFSRLFKDCSRMLQLSSESQTLSEIKTLPYSVLRPLSTFLSPVLL